MRGIRLFIRYFVSILFVFSGFIKANDPKGLSFKMQEFFEVWGVHGLNDYTLYLAVVLNTAEIVLGVALFLKWKPSFTNKAILGLVLFFTFLTGYTYWTGLPKNCGCFGDCLPLTPQISFLKDVALTLLLLIYIFIHKKDPSSKPILSYSGFYSFFSGFLIVLLQIYLLAHLPILDCLPFKEGADLIEGRKVPSNAVPDSTVIYFTYQKGRELVRFAASDFPSDFNSETYRFVKREDQIIRKGKNMEPPIKGFYLTGVTNIDSTDIILQLPSAILIFSEKTNDLKENFSALDRLSLQEYYPAIPVFIVTAQFKETRKLLSSSRFSGWPVFKCDLKTIQTAARTSPCIYLLSKGKVVRKKAAVDF